MPILRLSRCVSLLAATALLSRADSAPQPAVSLAAAFRFLNQASFGPTAAEIANVQQMGMAAYIDAQMQATPSPLPIPPAPVTGNPSMMPVQQQFFLNAVTGPDQLRQRVAFALNQIWVISAVKINQPAGMVNYLQTIQKDAFGNFRQLMYDITLTPGMGHYLDMVDNDKPAPGADPDENYAREILQLFTIGLNQLNDDGTVQTDASGNPIPTFTQDTIEAFARVFTGWTYAPAPGKASKIHNPPNWTAPMVAVDSNHDQLPKTLLNGYQMGAGQTAQQDLNDALDNIFNHPNVPPFISRQLIQHLVTSNPSPAYVKRISAVFADNGNGVRGDLSAVVKAILLDPEARAGDSAAPALGEGHLREPVLFIAGLLRELGATISISNNFVAYGNEMGQQIYFPATVFNYYSPGYDIAGTTINAPEFQILDGATALVRANFMTNLIYGNLGVDLSALSTMTDSAIIQALNTAMLGGTMPSDMQNTIATALAAQPTGKAKAEAAAYLIGSSWQYQVEQ